MLYSFFNELIISSFSVKFESFSVSCSNVFFSNKSDCTLYAFLGFSSHWDNMFRFLSVIRTAGIFFNPKFWHVSFKYSFSDLLNICSDKFEINSDIVINIGKLNNESGQKSSVSIIKFF